MAIPKVITSQTGGIQFDAPNITKYSGFVGGVNNTHHALLNYSPQMNGFGRLFMVRPPRALLQMFAGSDDLYNPNSLFIQFKHIMEYMNREITGFQDKTLEPASTAIQGGFAGRLFNTPTVTKDGTNSIQISLYEFDGSPIYTVIRDWMNAIGDEMSGLATYGGWISGGKDANGLHKRLYRRENESDEGIPFNEANHTAEFIYVLHDRSGAQVQRAVMLAGCYPTNISQSAALDMPSGGVHDNVVYNINFNCSVYQSPIIMSIANDLLKQYRIVSNSLNFNPELGDAIYGPNDPNLFQRSLGAIPSDSATGTLTGNVPAYAQIATAKTTVVQSKTIEEGKLAGQNMEYDPDWTGFVKN